MLWHFRGKNITQIRTVIGYCSVYRMLNEMENETGPDERTRAVKWKTIIYN